MRSESLLLGLLRANKDHVVVVLHNLGSQRFIVSAGFTVVDELLGKIMDGVVVDLAVFLSGEHAVVG